MSSSKSPRRRGCDDSKGVLLTRVIANEGPLQKSFVLAVTVLVNPTKPGAVLTVVAIGFCWMISICF